MKATMLQMMASCDQINGLYSWYSSVNDSLKIVNGNPRGDLGKNKLTIQELIENNIDESSIGSISFKLTFNGQNISCLLFHKSGKMRITFGCSHLTIDAKNTTLFNSYIEEVFTFLKYETELNIWNYNVTCLNGQMSLNKTFKDLTELNHFINLKKPNFQFIKLPNFDIPGRRGAYRMYINKSRKCHIALDVRGTAQIFGTKSYEELIYMASLLQC